MDIDFVSDNDTSIDANGDGIEDEPSLYKLFGDAGIQPILICLSGIRFLTAIFSIIANLALVYITIRNKNLHGTCNLFIASAAAFGLLAMSNFGVSFFLAITGQNFIPLGKCIPIMALAYFANIMWKLALFLLSFDRLLMVTFPLWFGQKPLIFYGATIAVASCYSAFWLFLTWSAVADEPENFVKPVTCIISDLSDIPPVGNFSLANSIALMALAAFNYLLLGAVLKWKSDKSEQEKSTRQYTRRLYRMLLATTSLTIFGWMFSPAVRLALHSIVAIGPLQTFYVSVTLSCVTIAAMTLNPVVLYLFSKDYKEAFRRSFPRIFGTKPPLTIKVVPLQQMTLQKSSTSSSQQQQQRRQRAEIWQRRASHQIGLMPRSELVQSRQSR